MGSYFIIYVFCCFLCKIIGWPSPIFSPFLLGRFVVPRFWHDIRAFWVKTILDYSGPCSSSSDTPWPRRLQHIRKDQMYCDKSITQGGSLASPWEVTFWRSRSPSRWLLIGGCLHRQFCLEYWQPNNHRATKIGHCLWEDIFRTSSTKVKHVPRPEVATFSSPRTFFSSREYTIQKRDLNIIMKQGGLALPSLCQKDITDTPVHGRAPNSRSNARFSAVQNLVHLERPLIRMCME